MRQDALASIAVQIDIIPAEFCVETRMRKFSVE